MSRIKSLVFAAALLATPAEASLAIYQNTAGVLQNGIPGGVTVGWTPVAGDLIIVCLHYHLSAAVITVNSPTWNIVQSAVYTGGNGAGIALYRYAQVGESASLPAFFTAGNPGSGGYAYQIYELNGTGGGWSPGDFQQAGATAISAGTSVTTPTLTTTASNSLALICGGQRGGNSNPTISAPWTVDQSSNVGFGFGNGASQASGHQTGITPGALSGTITYNGLGDSLGADAILIVFNGVQFSGALLHSFPP